MYVCMYLYFTVSTLDKKYLCGTSKSRTSKLTSLLLIYSFFSFLKSVLCIGRLMMDYWFCIDLLWMQNKERSEDPATSPDSSFFARFLTEVSLRTESIWNSRRSNRFKQVLGLLIHHLINSALLCSDLGPVPISLSNTSNTLSAQVKCLEVWVNTSKKKKEKCRAGCKQKFLWSDECYKWNEQDD